MADAMGPKERLDCVFHRGPVGRDPVEQNWFDLGDETEYGFVVFHRSCGGAELVSVIFLVSSPLTGMGDRLISEEYSRTRRH